MSNTFDNIKINKDENIESVIKQGGALITRAVPTGDSDTGVPTHYAIFGKGGYKEVKTIEDRNALQSTQRLETGCIVYVIDADTEYRWDSPEKNTWNIVSNAGGSSDSDTVRDFDVIEFYTKLEDPDIIPAKVSLNILMGYSDDHPYIYLYTKGNKLFPYEDTNKNVVDTFNAPDTTGNVKITWQHEPITSWNMSEYIWKMSIYITGPESRIVTDPVRINDINTHTIDYDKLEIPEYVYAYAYQDTKPNLPTSTAIPPVSDNTEWTSDLQTTNNDTSVWMIMAKGVVNNNEIVKFTSEYNGWSGPLRINGANGEIGADGTSIEFIYMTTQDEQHKPSSLKDNIDVPGYQNAKWPVGNTVFGEEEFNNANNTSYVSKWTDHPNGVTDIFVCEWMCVRYKIKGVYTAYTDPVLWSRYGKTGKDGDGYEYIYYRTTTENAPVLKYTREYYDAHESEQRDIKAFMEGDAYQERDRTEYYPAEDGWLDEPITLDTNNKFLYVSTRRRVDGVWGYYTAPALWSSYGMGQPGKDGTDREYIYLRNGGETPSETNLPDVQIQLLDEDYYNTYVKEPNFGVRIADQRKLGDEHAGYRFLNTDSTITSIFWEDHPQGVTSKANESDEWVAYRDRDANGNFTPYGHIARWSHYGDKGTDGDGIQYIFFATPNEIFGKLTIPVPAGSENTNEDFEDLPDNDAYQQANATYIKEWSGWSDNPVTLGDGYYYEYVSVRKFRDGEWEPYSEPKIWATYLKPSLNNGNTFHINYYFYTTENLSYLEFKQKYFTNELANAPATSVEDLNAIITELNMSINDSSAKDPNAVLWSTDYNNSAFDWSKYEGDGTSKGFTWMVERYINDNKVSGNWRGPVKTTGEAGVQGSDGTSIEFVYLRTKSNDKPDTPKPLHSYDGSVKIEDTEVKGNAAIVKDNFEPSAYINDNIIADTSWTDAARDIDDIYKYEWVSQRICENDVWSDYTEPVLWSRWGENGRDGDGIEYVYILGKGDGETDVPIINYPFNDEDEWWTHREYQELNGYGEYIPENIDGTKWSDNPLSVSTEYPILWVATRKKFTQKPKDDPDIKDTYAAGLESAQKEQTYWHKFTQPVIFSRYTPSVKGANGSYYERIWIAKDKESDLSTIWKDEYRDDNVQEFINRGWSTYVPNLNDASISGGWGIYEAYRKINSNESAEYWNVFRLSGASGVVGEDSTETQFIYARTKEYVDGYFLIDNEYINDSNIVQQAANGTLGSYIYTPKSEKVYQVDENGNPKEYIPGPARLYLTTTDGNGQQVINSDIEWHDEPQGVDDVYKYEWMAKRVSIQVDGQRTSWTDYSIPRIWSSFGRQGIDGGTVEYMYALLDVSYKPKRPVYNTPEGIDVSTVNEAYKYAAKVVYNNGTRDIPTEVLWTDEPEDVTKERQYNWVYMRKKRTGSDKWDETSAPILWAKFGDSADPGDAYNFYDLDVICEIDVSSATVSKYIDELNKLRKSSNLIENDKDAANILKDYLDIDIKGKCYKYIDNTNYVLPLVANASNNTYEQVVVRATITLGDGTTYYKDTLGNGTFIGYKDASNNIKCVVSDTMRDNDNTWHLKAIVYDYDPRNDAESVKNINFGMFKKSEYDHTASAEVLAQHLLESYDVTPTTSPIFTRTITDTYANMLWKDSDRISTINANINSLQTSYENIPDNVKSIMYQDSSIIMSKVTSKLSTSGIAITDKSVEITGTMQSDASLDYANGSQNDVPIWMLNKDGSGHLGLKNIGSNTTDGTAAISWDATGKVSIGGDLLSTITDATEKAAAGVAITITDTSTQYQVTNSPTNVPTTWQSSIVSATDDQPYLWSKTTVSYSDGTDVVSYNVTYKPKDGNNGVSPEIKNGYWYINGTSTGIKAQGNDGKTPTVTIGNNGNWYVNGVDLGIKAHGDDGATPTISNGYWYINGTNTNVKAQGNDGKTPYIGSNGNWWVDGEDTGTQAQGDRGDTPDITIGSNGNWYVDDTDTGVKAHGNDGKTPYIQDGYWYINGTNTNVKAQGPSGNTPTVTIGSNGNWYINGADTGKTAKGSNGEPGLNYVFVDNGSYMNIKLNNSIEYKAAGTIMKVSNNSATTYTGSGGYKIEFLNSTGTVLKTVTGTYSNGSFSTSGTVEVDTADALKTYKGMNIKITS